MGSKKNILGIITFLIVLAVLPVTVFLAQRPQDIRQRASELDTAPQPLPANFPIGPTGFGFLGPDNRSDNSHVVLGVPFQVRLLARSDVDYANLFSAKLTFSSYGLEVTTIEMNNPDSTFVTNIIEKSFDNSDGSRSGTISFVGGVPSPGYKTQGQPSVMAIITLRAKQLGDFGIEFADASAIYRDSDNANILDSKQRIVFTVSSTPTPTPTPSLLNVSPVTVNSNGTLNVTWSGIPNPHLGDYMNFATADDQHGVASHTYWIQNNCSWLTPDSGTPKPAGSCTINLSKEIFNTAFPPPYHLVLASGTTPGQTTVIAKSNNFTIIFPPTSYQKGDGNHDGKIDLTDMSVLLSNFNKTFGFPSEIDMNSDGAVNTFDYSLLINKLVELGIIHQGRGR